MPKVLKEYDCQCGCGWKFQVEQDDQGTYTCFVMEHARHGWSGVQYAGVGWDTMRDLIEQYDDYYGMYMDDGENTHAVILSRDDLNDLRILFGMGKRELPTAP